MANPTEVTDVRVTDLQASVLAGLVTVLDYSRLLDALLDSRQTWLTVLGPEAAAAQDSMTRADRAARVDRTKRDVGLAFMRGVPASTASGHVVAAVNVHAVASIRDVTDTVHGLTRWLVRHLAQLGVCPWPRQPPEASVDDRIRRLANLVHLVPRVGPAAWVLEAVARDVTVLEENVRAAVDGASSIRLGDPCPWCRRRSLIAHVPPVDGSGDPAAGLVIRCEFEERDDQPRPCTCPDPICTCKRSPVTFRHEWTHTPGTGPGTWLALKSQLALARQAQEPTSP